MTWNGQMYKDYSQAYQDIMSNNPNNNSYMDFLPPGTNVNDRLEYWQEIFRKRKDLYRRQRDLSIFAFIGVYLLSVIDAYVDAELSDFDISKDLSMKWEPTVFNDAFRNRPQGVGLQCCIKFLKDEKNNFLVYLLLQSVTRPLFLPNRQKKTITIQTNGQEDVIDLPEG